MKKQIIALAAASLILAFAPQAAQAQFGKKLLNKVKDGGGGGSAKPGKFASFNAETDPMGITGEYFAAVDAKHTFGLRFIKDEGGKLVNRLDFYEKKDAPTAYLHLKESYFNKNKVKLFCALGDNTYIELLEMEPGVFAQITSNYNNNGNAVPPDAERKVYDVLAKDKSKLSTWDLPTAQAKTEMIMASLNTEKMEKDKAKLMAFDAYKTYHGKVAFAKGANYFRNERYNEPKEKLEWMLTKAELGNTLAFKPYFEQPLVVSHPGAWFKITYEMAGETTDREALRKSSSFFSSNIPALENDKDKFYFFNGRSAIGNDGTADYAYLELLRKVKDKIKEGQSYDLTVKVWAYKDGENIAPLASGKIKMEYTKGSDGTKALLFDPASGWVPKMEKWIDQ